MKIILMLMQFFYASTLFGSIDLWDADRNSWTHLMVYTYKGEKNKMDSILNEGVDINESNNKGYTALWVAVMKKDSKIVKFLLEKGANPNATDTSGYSLLMSACETNGYRVIKLLLKQNALINYEKNGNTALQRAVIYCSPKVLRLLLAHGANVAIRRKVDNVTAFSLAKYNFYLGRVNKRKYKILKRHGAIE